MYRLNMLGEEERWAGREVREDVNTHSASKKTEEEAMKESAKVAKRKRVAKAGD